MNIRESRVQQIQYTSDGGCRMGDKDTISGRGLNFIIFRVAFFWRILVLLLRGSCS